MAGDDAELLLARVDERTLQHTKKLERVVERAEILEKDVARNTAVLNELINNDWAGLRRVVKEVLQDEELLSESEIRAIANSIAGQLVRDAAEKQGMNRATWLAILISAASLALNLILNFFPKTP